ncbi:MAG: hypothetical protein MI717_13145, partial [Spirochaetales bacterium]|nr:hypothetical protein [Spirochaetales bacterium]
MKFLSAALSFAIAWSATASALEIHPLCLEKLVPLSSSGAKTAPLDVKACTKQYNHLPYRHNTPWHATWEAVKANTAPDGEILPGYAAYNIIGGMKDNQTVIKQVVNYGGSGVFSYGLLIEGVALTSEEQSTPDAVRLTMNVPGGDRCLGGIEQLSITSPDTFTLNRYLTPAELVRYGQNDSSGAKGLADCAICCIGTIQESWSLSGESRLLGVTINPEDLNDSESEKTRCLYSLLPAKQARQK